MEKETDLLGSEMKAALEENDSDIEKDSPEVEFINAKKKKKNKIIAILLLTVLAETCGAVFLSYISVTENIQKRIMREFRYQTKGFVSTVKGAYTGEMDFGLFDGAGEFIFDTGTVYKGNWDNDQIHGLGDLKIPGEGIYEGDFLFGMKEGTGEFSWDDGDSYNGEWKADQMSGQGIYSTTDGVIYTGTFEGNEFKEGVCEFENTTGEYKINFKNKKISHADITYQDGTSYSGECNEDGINGSGTMSFTNNDSYSGEMENDKRSGKGVYLWPSGASYDGEWLNDDMSGTGTYTYSENNFATGIFEKNIFIEGSYHVSNDFGEYIFTIEEGEPTSVDMTLKDGTSYSGDMSDGKLNGTAQITYSNGDTYSGIVVDNQKSGQGTYTWTNGASYDGEWANDKMNGTGSYKYSPTEGGYVLTGEFKNGYPDGECTYYVSPSEYYKTDWADGSCVKVYE